MTVIVQQSTDSNGNPQPMVYDQDTGKIIVDSNGYVINGGKRLVNVPTVSEYVSTPKTQTAGIQEANNFNPNDKIKVMPGIYYISATIQLTGMGQILEGSGSGNQSYTGFQEDAVTTSIYASNGFNQDMLEMLGYNQKVCNIEFYGNSPNNTYDNTYHDGFTAVIAIGYKTYSGTPYHCIVDNVTIDEPLNWGVYIENNSDHEVLWSLIQISQTDVSIGSSGGIYVDRISSDGSNTTYGHNRILGNRLYNLNSGINLSDNNSFTFFNKIDNCGISVGGNFQQVCYNRVTGAGGSGISWGSNGGNCIGNTIFGSGVAGSGHAGIKFTGGYGNFMNNHIDGSATYGETTARSSYGINIASNPTGGFTPKFKYNLFSGAYISSVINFASGTTQNDFIIDNTNDMSNSTPAYTFTPTTPSVPSSGTAQENTNPYPVDVYIYGGTVTEIQITRGGTAYTVFSNSTGLALSGQAYKLNPTDSITVTYTTAPDWEWLSD